MQAPTKEQIFHMLRYVLETKNGDSLSEKELLHWYDVIMHISKIRQKFPSPTTGILTIGDEIFDTTKAKISLNDGIQISTNKIDRHFKKEGADFSVYGDVRLNAVNGNLKVIGNLSTDSIVAKNVTLSLMYNIGDITINCAKLECDDLRCNGNIIITANDVSTTTISAKNLEVDANLLKSTFINADLVINHGKIDNFGRDTNDENWNEECDKIHK